MHEHTTIGVDLAKSVFELAVSDQPGAVALRRRLTRGQFSSFLAERPPATIVMEACGSAHFWGREAQKLGHRVVLLPPHAVRPYALRNKTDGADARALLEALRNGALCAVPAVRALCAQGDAALPAPLQRALRAALAEITELEVRMRDIERTLEALASESALVARLRSVPGVGLLTATALVAFVGDAARFPSGRHFASYLGLTPRESSSGLKRKLGRISKRGDPYLRMLLIHGARSVLAHAKRDAAPRDGLRAWALSRETARGHNKAAVALANKLARIAWAVWRNEQPFQPRKECAVP